MKTTIDESQKVIPKVIIGNQAQVDYGNFVHAAIEDEFNNGTGKRWAVRKLRQLGHKFKFEVDIFHEPTGFYIPADAVATTKKTHIIVEFKTGKSNGSAAKQLRKSAFNLHKVNPKDNYILIILSTERRIATTTVCTAAEVKQFKV